MTKLGTALRRKFKTPEAALKALGLDKSVLKGIMAGDSKLPALADNAKDTNPMKTILMTRKAAMTMGAAIPFLRSKGLAKDAMPDWSKVLNGVTAKNFAEKKGNIVAGIKEATKGKLAKDASLEGLVSLLDAVEDEEPDEIDSKDAMETDPNSGVPMEAHTDMEDKSMDDDPHAGLKDYLKGKGMSEDDIDGACNALAPGSMDAELGTKKADEEGEDEKEDEEEMKEKKGEDKGAKDEPPPFKGKPKVGGGMDSASVTKAIKASQQANDAAIKEAIKLAREESAATREAERFVRPWVGDLAMAHDSAAEVYKTTLTALGKNVEGVHPSAYKAILESMPLPNSKRQAHDETLAMDSSASAEFAKKWPGVARIGHA